MTKFTAECLEGARARIYGAAFASNPYGSPAPNATNGAWMMRESNAWATGYWFVSECLKKGLSLEDVAIYLDEQEELAS